MQLPRLSQNSFACEYSQKTTVFDEVYWARPIAANRHRNPSIFVVAQLMKLAVRRDAERERSRAGLATSTKQYPAWQQYKQN